MEWNAEIGTKDLLNRIVALLLSLADCAERAAAQSAAIRCRVLWALRQADWVATEFVAGSACNAVVLQGSPDAMSGRDGNDPADAIDLAASLRLLALIVRTIAAQIRCPLSQDFGATNMDVRLVERACRTIQCMLTAALLPIERRDTS